MNPVSKLAVPLAGVTGVGDTVKAGPQTPPGVLLLNLKAIETAIVFAGKFATVAVPLIW